MLATSIMMARRVTVGASSLVFAVMMLAPVRVSAQSTPAVLYGCYVPASGTVYRIKADGLPAECRSKNHVQFTWSLQGPPGPQGPAGPAGIQGVAGPSGPIAGRVIVSASGSAQPNQSGTAVALCPAGTKVLGGGFSGPVASVSVNQNEPAGGSATDSGWQVVFVNTSQPRLPRGPSALTRSDRLRHAEDASLGG